MVDPGISCGFDLIGSDSDYHWTMELNLLLHENISLDYRLEVMLKDE